MTADDQELMRLLNLVLNLAVDDDAPTNGMMPMTLLLSSLQTAIANRDDPDALVATLVGTLAWVARERWAEVSAEVRQAEGSVLQ